LIYYKFSKEKPLSEINKKIWKRKTLSSDTWQHQGMPRAMLMSAEGQYLLTLVVGPGDVSIDQSTLNGQRSTRSAGQWDPLVSLTSRLTGGVHSSAPVLG
jgi:hypothetical protein